VRKILLALLLLTVGAAAAAYCADSKIRRGAIVVVPVKGGITDAQLFFLRRALKDAEAAGASGFILNMDTPGGEYKATEKIVQALLKATMPTLTYVNTNAGSAGALIALGTRAVYMAPVSAIGAAAPILSTGAEVPETMNAKMVSYFSGYFRSVAAINGYDPNLVDAFMNLDKEVKIGDTVLNPKGSVLTLSAQEAVKEYDGKPLLAKGIASSIEDVVAQAGLRGNIVYFDPSGFEQIAQWITLLAPLFLLGGILGAYLEFKTPGFGIAGFGSVFCFLLFFTGHYIAGLTGLEAAAVFVLGLILVLLELIFFPGVIFVAAIGTALMFGALFFAMVDYFPGQSPNLDPAAFVQPMVNLSITLILAILVISLFARFLPDLPLFRRLVLVTRSPSGPSLSPAPAAVFRNIVSIGDTGTAASILRPAGKAEFGAALIDVVTDGDFLETGTKVRIERIEGSRIVVSAV
jgi:membrane-bound serine protease (ClpP class)